MPNKLFSDPFPEVQDATVSYESSFYALAKAEHLKTSLLEETPWRQNKIQLYGKTHNEPRLTQLYGDENIVYGYSGINFKALPWTETIKQIKKRCRKSSWNYI